MDTIFFYSIQKKNHSSRLPLGDSTWFTRVYGWFIIHVQYENLYQKLFKRNERFESTYILIINYIARYHQIEISILIYILYSTIKSALNRNVYSHYIIVCIVYSRYIDGHWDYSVNVSELHDCKLSIVIDNILHVISNESYGS